MNGLFKRCGSGVLMTPSSPLHYRCIKKVKLSMMLLRRVNERQRGCFGGVCIHISFRALLLLALAYGCPTQSCLLGESTWRVSGTAAIIIINHTKESSWGVLWSLSRQWRTTQTRLLKFKLSPSPCFRASPRNKTLLKEKCDSAHRTLSTVENVKHVKRIFT